MHVWTRGLRLKGPDSAGLICCFLCEGLKDEHSCERENHPLLGRGHPRVHFWGFFSLWGICPATQNRLYSDISSVYVWSRTDDIC